MNRLLFLFVFLCTLVSCSNIETINATITVNVTGYNTTTYPNAKLYLTIFNYSTFNQNSTDYLFKSEMNYSAGTWTVQVSNINTSNIYWAVFVDTDGNLTFEDYYKYDNTPIGSPGTLYSLYDGENKVFNIIEGSFDSL